MEYRAHGKFLLSGEYMVLKGAKALALPLKYGQRMQVSDTAYEGCRWYSAEKGNAWFEATLDSSMCVTATNLPAIGDRLDGIMASILRQRPEAVNKFRGKEFRFDTDFDRDWGLGTSSTLLALLAEYAGVDPYRLLADTFGGSGYDLACAIAPGPLFFTRREGRPLVEPAPFDPPFKEQIFFVYLGNKQNSSAEVKKFFKEALISDTDVQRISELAEAFCTAATPRELAAFMKEHEQIMSRILQAQTVQEKYFPDFAGAVKSMGAWGGDFVMVVSENEEKVTRKYFFDKGFVTILGYSNVLLRD